jgi:hypothetical protein
VQAFLAEHFHAEPIKRQNLANGNSVTTPIGW